MKNRADRGEDRGEDQEENHEGKVVKKHVRSGQYLIGACQGPLYRDNICISLTLFSAVDSVPSLYSRRDPNEADLPPEGTRLCVRNPSSVLVAVARSSAKPTLTLGNPTGL